MKRYLIIGGYKEIIAKDNLTKTDLVNLKEHFSDWIIDSNTEMYFDSKENIWKAIEDESNL